MRLSVENMEAFVLGASGHYPDHLPWPRLPAHSICHYLSKCLENQEGYVFDNTVTLSERNMVVRYQFHGEPVLYIFYLTSCVIGAFVFACL